MALKWLRTVWNTVLHYQRSRHRPPALHSCSFLLFLLWMHVFLKSTSIHERRVKGSAAVVASSLTKISTPHLQNVDSPITANQPFHLQMNKCSTSSEYSSPNIIQSCQESTRAFVNPTELLGTPADLQLYLCKLGHH